MLLDRVTRKPSLLLWGACLAFDEAGEWGEESLRVLSGTAGTGNLGLSPRMTGDAGHVCGDVNARKCK